MGKNSCEGWGDLIPKEVRIGRREFATSSKSRIISDKILCQRRGRTPEIREWIKGSSEVALHTLPATIHAEDHVGCSYFVEFLSPTCDLACDLPNRKRHKDKKRLGLDPLGPKSSISLLRNLGLSKRNPQTLYVTFQTGKEIRIKSVWAWTHWAPSPQSLY